MFGSEVDRDNQLRFDGIPPAVLRPRTDRFSATGEKSYCLKQVS